MLAANLQSGRSLLAMAEDSYRKRLEDYGDLCSRNNESVNGKVVVRPEELSWATYCFGTNHTPLCVLD